MAKNKQEANGKEENGNMLSSRKYLLAILIFAVATLLCGLPPTLSIFVFKNTTPLIILTGSEWVAVVSMIGAFYFGANVTQKTLLNGENGTTEKPTEPPKQSPEEVKNT